MPDPFQMEFVYKELLHNEHEKFWAVYQRESDPKESYIATVLFLVPTPEKPKAYIGWLGVTEQWQRQGLATVILDRIRHRFACGIDPGVMTVDGEAFWHKYEQHVTSEAV